MRNTEENAEFFSYVVFSVLFTEFHQHGRSGRFFGIDFNLILELDDYVFILATFFKDIYQIAGIAAKPRQVILALVIYQIISSKSYFSAYPHWRIGL